MICIRTCSIRETQLFLSFKAQERRISTLQPPDIF
jgi:hypothetical protein